MSNHNTSTSNEDFASRIKKLRELHDIQGASKVKETKNNGAQVSKAENQGEDEGHWHGDHHGGGGHGGGEGDGGESVLRS